MFNVAVVNGKAVLKYLVSVTIVFCLVMFVNKYFSGGNRLQINEKISEIMQANLLICLDETIPGIKETNHELKSEGEEQIKENAILGSLLKVELTMFSEEQKVAKVENTTSSQKEENMKNEEREQEENIEVSRRCNHRSGNRKSFIRQLQFGKSRSKNKK